MSVLPDKLPVSEPLSQEEWVRTLQEHLYKIYNEIQDALTAMGCLCQLGLLSVDDIPSRQCFQAILDQLDALATTIQTSAEQPQSDTKTKRSYYRLQKTIAI